MVLVIFSLHLCTNAYNELLYKAVAENLTQSAYTISDSLNSIVNMSSSIIAAPEIQTSLSNIIRMNDRVAWTNANRIINNSLQTYFSSVRGNGASFMMIQNRYFNNSTYTTWKNRLSEERFQAAIDAAASKKGAAAWISGDPGSNALLISREIREIDHLSLAPLGTLIVYVDLNNIIEKAMPLPASIQTVITFFAVIKNGFIYRKVFQNRWQTILFLLPRKNTRF